MTKHAKSLLEELDMGHLSDEENKALLGQLAETLQNRIMVRLMDTLSEADKKNMDGYLAKKDIDGFNQYLAENVPGFDGIALDEYQKLRQELITANEEIAEAVKAAKK